MHTMKISTGGFVYPQKEKEKLAEQKPAKYHLANNTGIIKTFGFEVPQNENIYLSFKGKMKYIEDNLKNYLT